MPGITNPAEEYFKDGVWAWDPAGSKWLKLIIDPLTNRLVIDHPGDLEVVQPTPADLCVANHGWDGSAWRKLPMLFGYSDTYREVKVKTLTADVAWTLEGSTVGDGEVWVVTQLLAYNATGTNTEIDLQVYDGSTSILLRRDYTTVKDDEIIYTGWCVLKKDDRIQAWFRACHTGDVVVLHIHGFKMKIAE